MIYFMLLYPVNIQSIPRQKILESKHLLLAVNIIFLKPFHRSIWKKWKNKKICLCSSCILLSRLVNLTNSSRLKILKLTFLFHFIKHFCRCWQLLCALGIETKVFFFFFLFQTLEYFATKVQVGEMQTLLRHGVHMKTLSNLNCWFLVKEKRVKQEAWFSIRILQISKKKIEVLFSSLEAKHCVLVCVM